jgi:hypothetical protein
MHDLTAGKTMRLTGRAPRIATSTSLRMLRLAAVLLGIGLVSAAGTARAADDEDEETFEEKVIGGIMRGLGGTNMENTGIEYRERSPLVVPPKIELRPPDNAAAETKVPNWPKDQDLQRRKAAIAASRKKKPDPEEAARPLLPSELAQKTSGTSVAGSESLQPGTAGAQVLSPSQLGFPGFSKMFSGNTAETAPFKGEPTRESLTQPPTGYQTPSPAYAYGTGPKESLNTRLDVMSGKEVKY